jgi:hypothetical protein
LAWGKNKLNTLKLSTTYTVTAPSTDFKVYAEPGLKGIEVVSSTRVFTCGSNGIRYYTIGTTTATLVTSAYTNTELEMPRNLKLMCVSNTGQLAYINNPTSVPVLVVATYSPLLKSNGYSSFTSVYKLPDQIEYSLTEYQNFFGTPLPTAAFKVNNATVYATCTPAPLQVYNCTGFNITMSNQSVNATQYQVIVEPTNGSCVITGGPVYTSAWLNIFPTDLKNMPGANGTYLSINTGFFKITLKARNACLQESIKVGHIKVSATPTPVSMNLKINNGIGGVPCYNQVLPGCLVGCYGGNCNLGDGSNNIGTYQLTIQQVNCSNGTVLTNLYTGPVVTVSNVSQLTGIAFNSLTAGYFTINCTSILNTCYKLTATVTNSCGSVTDWSYFKVDGAYMQEPDDANGSKADLTNQKIRMIVNPNPLSQGEILHLDFVSENPEIVEIDIRDLQGRIVLQLGKQQLEKGYVRKDFNTEFLAKGLYLITMNGQIGTSKKLVVQ